MLKQVKKTVKDKQTMLMAKRTKTEGFGFIPTESEHHFLVTISRHKKDDVTISEHFFWDETSKKRELSLALGQEDNKLRVILPRLKWDAIADEVRAYFNQKLRENGLKTGQWKQGENPVSRLLGKELVLLCWAIEDADPALIPVAIKNWLGLKPEERWWLFTMTNAATGHAISGRNKGWRKAIRYALTENPVSGELIPSKAVEMPLFTLESPKIMV
jgi:hypothetical protein